MEKTIENTIVYRDYIGTMEKKVETTGWDGWRVRDSFVKALDRSLPILVNGRCGLLTS